MIARHTPVEQDRPDNRAQRRSPSIYSRCGAVHALAQQHQQCSLHTHTLVYEQLLCTTTYCSKGGN
jgi:hypothetical protein